VNCAALPLRQFFRVLPILGTSLIGLGAAAVTAKVSAVAGGAAGAATLALVTAAATFVTLIADVNIGQGVVRFASRALADHDRPRFDAMIWTARRITVLGGAISTAAAFLLESVTTVSLPRTVSYSLTAAASAGAFAMWAIQEGNALAVFGATARRSLCASAGAILIAASTCGSIVLFGLQFAAYGVAVGSAASAAFHRFVASRTIGPLAHPVGWARTAQDLIAFGGPMTLNVAAGYGLMTLLPFLVQMRLGTDSLGYLKAALGLSALYMGAITAVLTIEYYPRISRTPFERISSTAELYMRSAASLLLLAVVSVGVAGPLLVRTLYTGELLPAAELLRWWIIGDLLKAASWCLTFVLLAHARPMVLLGAEFAAGIVAVIGAPLLGERFGVRGIGLSNVLTYAVYLGIVTNLTRKHVQLRISQDVWRFVLTSMVIAVAFALFNSAQWNAVLALLVAIVVCRQGRRVVAFLREAPSSRTNGSNGAHSLLQEVVTT
jgi:O-antigen/teichoic acid export membrane protein